MSSESDDRHHHNDPSDTPGGGTGWDVGGAALASTEQADFGIPKNNDYYSASPFRSWDEIRGGAPPASGDGPQARAQQGFRTWDEIRQNA